MRDNLHLEIERKAKKLCFSNPLILPLPLLISAYIKGEQNTLITKTFQIRFDVCLNDNFQTSKNQKHDRSVADTKPGPLHDEKFLAQDRREKLRSIKDF